jgi:protein SCO1/2
MAARLAFVVLAGALLAGACRARANADELPKLGQIGNFSLTDQSGKPFSSQSLQQATWVAAFMFTRCPTVCPRITARMRDLQVEAKRRDLGLRFVSFSVDPEYDTPDVLRRYADEHRANLDGWSFLTGDLETVKKTSVDGFKLALEGQATAGAEHYGILHGSHLVLVGRGLGIRGYYRTSDDAEMQRLITDAERLAAR